MTIVSELSHTASKRSFMLVANERTKTPESGSYGQSRLALNDGKREERSELFVISDTSSSIDY